MQSARHRVSSSMSSDPGAAQGADRRCITGCAACHGQRPGARERSSQSASAGSLSSRPSSHSSNAAASEVRTASTESSSGRPWASMASCIRTGRVTAGRPAPRPARAAPRTAARSSGSYQAAAALSLSAAAVSRSSARAPACRPAAGGPWPGRTWRGRRPACEGLSHRPDLVRCRPPAALQPVPPGALSSSSASSWPKAGGCAAAPRPRPSARCMP